MSKIKCVRFLINHVSQGIHFMIFALLINLQNNAQTITSTSQNIMSNLLVTPDDSLDSNDSGISSQNNFDDNIQLAQNIRVLELRNYLIKPGRRDEFINYFEENFVNSQNALGGYILGQYRIKGAPDNFLWMRGFHDMPSRYKFLNEFYYSSFWKAHKTVPNSLLLNNGNVYLLTPLNINDSSASNETGFNSAWFAKEKGIAVIDFYISNTKLDKLIKFFKKQYCSILSIAGVQNTSFWISEMATNDFTALPVFQDKNLLVQITFYKNELEYQTKMKIVDAKMNEEQKLEFADLVTLKNTLIAYTKENVFQFRNKNYRGKNYFVALINKVKNLREKAKRVS